MVSCPSDARTLEAAAARASCVMSAFYLLRRALRRLVLAVGVLIALIVGLDRRTLDADTLSQVAPATPSESASVCSRLEAS